MEAEIAIVQNSAGDAWVPSGSNSIVNLSPGVGYQIFTTSADPIPFTYQITGAAPTRSSLTRTAKAVSRNAYFTPVSQTGLPYHIFISSATIDMETLP